jgi:hypothetical protein
MFEAAKDTKTINVVALLGAGVGAALKTRIRGDGQELHDPRNNVLIKSRMSLQVKEQTAELSSISREVSTREKEKGAAESITVEKRRSSLTMLQGADQQPTKLPSEQKTSKVVRRVSILTPEPRERAETPKNDASKELGEQGQLWKEAVKTPPPAMAHLSHVSPTKELSVRRSGSNSPAPSSQRTKSVGTDSGKPDVHRQENSNPAMKERAPITEEPPVAAMPVPTRPLSSVPVDIITPLAAPPGTPPGTIDPRVAELIALANDDELPAITGNLQSSQVEEPDPKMTIGGLDVVDEMSQEDTPIESTFKVIAGVGGAIRHDLAKKSPKKEDEEEVKPLIVNSDVTLAEPRPLRLTEVSRMLKMARFGMRTTKSRASRNSMKSES